jgi:hypothetical protein
MRKIIEKERRLDWRMAELVQYGMTLRAIIGLAEAQRYLLSRYVPPHVVNRALNAVGPRPSQRGSHRNWANACS